MNCRWSQELAKVSRGKKEGLKKYIKTAPGNKLEFEIGVRFYFLQE